MGSDFIYHRILLKVSGEALKGDKEFGYDPDSVSNLVSHISTILNEGVEVGLVVGAGNIWRGETGKNLGMEPVKADYMGMLATIMNSLSLKDAFERAGINCEVQTSTHMYPIAEPFDHSKAIKYLEEGRVVIFAGGTGHPFFTTDTAAALRALEIGAEAVLKATKVDGVYSDDPMKNPKAVRYDKITYDEALCQNLKIMDSTAFSLCKVNNMPIIVFNFSDPENLTKVLSGDTDISTIISN
jgi:uridylate kinase